MSCIQLVESDYFWLCTLQIIETLFEFSYFKLFELEVFLNFSCFFSFFQQPLDVAVFFFEIFLESLDVFFLLDLVVLEAVLKCGELALEFEIRRPELLQLFYCSVRL